MSALPGPGLTNYLRLAEASLRAGDTLRAQKIGREASERGFEHPNLLILAVYEYVNAQDYTRALAAAGRACELAPRSVDALNALGYCLTLAHQNAQAISTFDKALRLSPASAPVHFNKGLALERSGELVRARRQYLRAADLDPRQANALGRASYLAALQGDMVEAAELGSRALAHDPKNIFAALGLSLSDIQTKAFDEAVARLRPIAANPMLDPITRSLAYGIMADAEDAAGRKPEAFAFYRLCGEVLQIPNAPPANVETALKRVQRLTRYFQATSQEAWRQTTAGLSPVRTHTFLLGFPRSGTTLLEQVLAAHPDIEAMDERDCLIQSYRYLDSDNTLDEFAKLDTTQLDALRQSYWDEARKTGMQISRQCFVDKMPLNSVSLCLIARLFPEAKIIFALRDPRDVVLSCFRRRFGLTQQMYELLTPEGAAAYYDAVMTLCGAYRERLVLQVKDFRYETLVEDFEGRCRDLCDFLNIPYREEMQNFVAAAQARDIDTPSASQIVQGLNRRGIGQWRDYRAELAPVMPVLTPWVARFGYSES